MVTQAFFEDIQPQIVKELQASQQSIYVAVAWFTDNELFEILCKKAKNNISISVLILNDEINTREDGIDFNLLRDASGEVSLIGSKEEMMHNKFCVIDNKTVITGSYNWTWKARLNDENITITKDNAELASDFITEFYRLSKKYTGSTTSIDINTIIKRLEIIKNCIAIQDYDDILYQTGKLKKIIENRLPEKERIEIWQILKSIDQKAYGEAVLLISYIINTHSKLTIWIDPEIQGLQLEIKALSLQISSLEDELADIEKGIHEFEVQHTQQLGALILKILFLKRSLAEKQIKQDPLNEKVQKEYEEAKADEEQYKGTFQETINEHIQYLDDEEEKELKTKFRRITKLTHPDLVDKQFEKEAAELFMKAKKAKDKNDLTTINEILEYLEAGEHFKLKHETINQIDALRSEAKRLRFVIEELLKKIITIKKSETYQTITKISDWKEYFAETKTKL